MSNAKAIAAYRAMLIFQAVKHHDEPRGLAIFRGAEKDGPEAVGELMLAQGLLAVGALQLAHGDNWKDEAKKLLGGAEDVD